MPENKLGFLKKGSSLASAVEKDRQVGNGVAVELECLMMCIDCSASMRSESEGADSALHGALSAADMLAEASGPMSRVGAIAFTENVAQIVQPTVPRHELRKALKQFHEHSGGTVFYMPIKRACDAIDRMAGVNIRRIIFLSDGEDTSGAREDLNHEIQRCVQSRIIVDTVAFGEGAGHDLLRWMSERTGGVFKFAKDANELRKVFLSLEAGARGLLGSGKKK